jgi:hypothetical protein
MFLIAFSLIIIKFSILISFRRIHMYIEIWSMELWEPVEDTSLIHAYYKNRMANNMYAIITI